MNRITCLIAVILLSLAAGAKSIDSLFVIHFSINSSELTLSEQSQLNKLMDYVNAYGDYELELSAHTDQLGNRGFNQRLSERREDAVREYLVKKGLDPELILGNSYGEEQPAELLDDETESAVNRRVEIRVRVQVFEGVDEIYGLLRKDAAQEFVLKGNGPQEIAGNRGCQLLIPADAFETVSGRAVPNGEVVFELEEYPGFAEAITHRLSTLANGELLSSGGMFRIGATSGGEELRLRKDKSIKVRMPSDNLQKGMTVYTGYETPGGVVQWTNTGDPFEAVDTSEKAKLPLPGMAETLFGYRVPLPDMPVITAIDWNLQVPLYPLRPHEPREPELPVKPEKTFRLTQSRFPWLHRTYWKDRENEKKYRHDLELFTKRMEQYEKSRERYIGHMEAFLKDSARYVSDLENWYRTLDTYLATRHMEITTIGDRYDLLRWNGIHTSVGKRMNDSLFYSAHLTATLHNGAYSRIESRELTMLESLYSDVYWLQVLKDNEPAMVRKYGLRRGKLDFGRLKLALKRERLKDYTEMSTMKNRAGTNLYAQEMEADSNYLALLDDFEAGIRTGKEKYGIFDKSDAPDMYTTSVSSMGLFNCDRLADVPEKQLAVVDVSKADIRNTMVCLHNRKCMIPLDSWCTHGKPYVRLPLGERVTFVSISEVDGRAYFGMQRIQSLGQGVQVDVATVPVRISTIQRALSAL